MLIEAAVLCREERVHHVVGDAVEGHGAAVLHKDPAQFIAVPVKYTARDFHLLQLGKIERMGEIVAGLAVKEGPGETDNPDDQKENEAETGKFQPEYDTAFTLCFLLRFFTERWELDDSLFRAVTAADRFKIIVFEVVGHGRLLSKGLGEFTMGAMHPEFENPLQKEDTPLFEVVFQRIQKSPDDSIPFSAYMEIALYDETHGYYASPETRKVGRKGDFYTSVSVGETFGFLLAEKITAVRGAHFDPGAPFVIVEQGAHDGQLAFDILAALRRTGISGVEYRIVDPRPATREWLTGRFAAEGFGESVKVVGSLEDAKAAQGLFLCNELLDAFPFRRLLFDGEAWRELQVGKVGELPAWVERPLEPELKSYAVELGTEFSPGYTTEVCPSLDRWLAEAATLLEKGFWWLIDYGHESADYFAPHRKDGTFRCYRNHEATEDPFRHPGETDITAHVNFTHVRRAAEAAGLNWHAFTDQHHFLIEAARDWLLSIEGQTPNEETAKRLRQFQTLTHPGMMGTQFKIAELSKGID